MKLIEHPDREALTLAVAQDITDALGMALNTCEQAVLCLPGGSTPVPVFKALSAARLDWGRVLVVPGDERWVPGDHPRSNARLIRRNLIDEGAVVQGSVLMPGVRVGRNAVVRNAILDKNVRVVDDGQIGVDVEHDRERYQVSAGGIVAVGKNLVVD